VDDGRHRGAIAAAVFGSIELLVGDAEQFAERQAPFEGGAANTDR
jgi:hypothetical protein